MTTVITRGAASAQALGYAASSGGPVYVEDVFSTYVYTGNSNSYGTQTITNNIDLSGKGGLVWVKARSGTNIWHMLSDTARGPGTSATTSNVLSSNSDEPSGLSGVDVDYVSAFNSNGFTVKHGGAISQYQVANYLNNTYCSWTFRKQAKFFDVVTYTGNGANRTIAHNLGSVPGFIIVKNTTSTTNWPTYHVSDGNTKYTQLNNTGLLTDSTVWNNTTPTSTVFSVGTSALVNNNGDSYVAYLFANNAGGFGASGTDNVITCGSYTGNGSSQSISLGYEPQFLIIKGATQSWVFADIIRGAIADSADSYQNLSPNNVTGETSTNGCSPYASGFNVRLQSSFDTNSNGVIYKYIAIRRGPMKTPTSGTSVFTPIARTGTGAAVTVTGVGFPPDWLFTKSRSNIIASMVVDRLRGTPYLQTTSTAAEIDNSAVINNTVFSTTMDGFRLQGSSLNNFSAYTYINYLFRRAPGFFDEVCYTGTGSARTVTHNLGVVPELIIVKRRSATGAWPVYSSALNNTEYMVLDTTAAKATGATYWNSTTPTASVFSIGTAADVNTNTATYVAYLFATVAGVSKVGSYTGSGTTKQIDCGFTGGARFVLIKRTDSTGDWYVWDSARGIVAGNDPYLLLNSTAAEVTGTDYVDTYSAGFEISSTAPADINANGGTFIFLAIA